MQVVKMIPLTAFCLFLGQVMYLREFTYQTGIILAILAIVSFAFTYFDTTDKIDEFRKEQEELRKLVSDKIKELEEENRELSSSIASIKVNNNIKSRRF